MREAADVLLLFGIFIYFFIYSIKVLAAMERDCALAAIGKTLSTLFLNFLDPPLTTSVKISKGLTDHRFPRES